MRNYTATFGWILALVFGILLFVILFQNQQNTHNEKIMDRSLEMIKVNQVTDACILKTETVGDRIKKNLKSCLEFMVSIFSKIF